MTEATFTLDLSTITDRLDRMERKQDEILKAVTAKEPPVEPSDFKTVLSLDFDSHPVGPYTDAMLKADWKGGSLWTPNTTRIESIQGAKRLVSHYPKGTFGRGGGLNQVFELAPLLAGKKAEEVTLSYDIIFQEGFDWSITGKTPGFGFGPVKTLISGGKVMLPTGGSTVRLVWEKDGKIKPYVYAHGKEDGFGEGMGLGPSGQFIPGQKHRIEMRIKANDLGKANGILEVKQDGKLILSTANIEYRIKESPQFIDSFALSTFMGGDDERFAPDHDQWMALDNIEIRVR